MRAESEHARCLYFYNINTQDFNAAGSYLNETDLKQNYFYHATLTVAWMKCIQQMYKFKWLHKAAHGRNLSNLESKIL